MNIACFKLPLIVIIFFCVIFFIICLSENATCNRPPPVEGAITPRLRDTQHAVGTVVNYRCDYGYVSKDSARFQSVCGYDEESGKVQWSNPNVACIRKSIIYYALHLSHSNI